jgi:hypothetical protein
MGKIVPAPNLHAMKAYKECGGKVTGYLNSDTK